MGEGERAKSARAIADLRLCLFKIEKEVERTENYWQTEHELHAALIRIRDMAREVLWSPYTQIDLGPDA